VITERNTHELVGAAVLLRRVTACSPTVLTTLPVCGQARRTRGRGGRAALSDSQAAARLGPRAYRSRNPIERRFCRLNDWRRVAPRKDKRADTMLSGVLLAASLTGSTASDLEPRRTFLALPARWVVGPSLRAFYGRVPVEPALGAWTVVTNASARAHPRTERLAMSGSPWKKSRTSGVGGFRRPDGA
jgi:putative transposase